MTRALVCHPGTQYSYHLARQLEKHQRLGGFHTGVAIASDGLLAGICAQLPRGLRRRLANRLLDGVPRQRLHLHPIPEIISLVRQHVNGGQSEVNLHHRNRRFQSAIPSHVTASTGAVIGFDTSSWILAKYCRQAGVPFVLDQSIGHPDSKIRVYKQIMDTFPQWEENIEARLPQVRRVEQVEHDLADIVVAASSFTVRTLVENGVAADKIRVNPYGVDIARFKMGEKSMKRPVRFVFVGSITSRKGVPLLLEAWRRLRPGSAELWLVGPIDEPVRRLIPAQPGLRVVGAVPNIEVPQILQQCDVLVFPSYFEGFGLVIPEAMACGLPVIATDATAAPDIYEDGEGGWIVPVGDADALTARIERCLSKPDRTRDMGRLARRIAEKQTWAAYGDRWVNILDSLPVRV